jgi:hypothetical protein
MSFPFLSAPKDDKERLMADTMRVLSLAPGKKLWMDELSAELGAFRQTLDREEAFSGKDLRNSVKALEALRIVTAEERVTAALGKPRPNLLVELAHTESLERLLMLDADVRQYRTISSSYQR